ncbi:MAG: ClpX C4-type zinc finger protein, partial [Planctomycetota bacterium]|nr:ClpX C4-type zinc finger protein [Planctomycetota bacterium]
MSSTGKKSGTGGRGSGSGSGGSKGPKVCSFCHRGSDDAGPVIEGPNGVYICANCVDLCHNIVRQQQRRTAQAQAPFTAIPIPR